MTEQALVQSISAYILAGGRSRRFGGDKARALFQGKPLIMRLHDALRSSGFDVWAVAQREGGYADLGVPTVADVERDRGPVGGLRTALAHRVEGWALVCSCDMLDLPSEWLAALLAGLKTSPDVDAIAARDDRWQPFPGLYHTRLAEQEALHTATSFQELLSACRAKAIDAGTLPPLRHANTRRDLDRFAGESGA